MDYEKKYKNALAHAREIHRNEEKRKDMEFLFPELRESKDEMIREDLIQWISEFPDMIWRGHYREDVITWLEKQGEQKPAWSEEDEEMFDYTLSMIEWYVGVDEDKSKPVSNWLKSLKGKYTWKPSKEQIMALRWVLNHIPYDSHKEEISGLLDQIKDL